MLWTVNPLTWSCYVFAAWIGVVATAASVCISSAGAALWTDSHKLTAAGSGSGDRFGTSVALDGDTALVGAKWNDDSGNKAGAAYLYSSVTGLPLQSLVASDAEVGDEFGFSTALSGSLALVGAPFEDVSGSNAGAAYLFDLAGVQQAKLPTTFLSGGENFGYSVAIDGDRAVVGALEATSTSSVTDAAYVFEKQVGVWQFTKMLTADDLTGGDKFGWSVALHGTTAVVMQTTLRQRLTSLTQSPAYNRQNSQRRMLAIRPTLIRRVVRPSP